jgi:hypothetical protein
MKKKSNAGRKTVMTEETVKKLVDAFSMGFTDEEACIYSEITKQTLYNYCEKNPKFLTKKELLKHKPKIKAKLNILNSINSEDLETSKWYLERKSKDEFSTKTETNSKMDLEIKSFENAKDFLKKIENEK